jgi:hypothetical protein
MPSRIETMQIISIWWSGRILKTSIEQDRRQLPAEAHRLSIPRCTRVTCAPQGLAVDALSTAHRRPAERSEPVTVRRVKGLMGMLIACLRGVTSGVPPHPHTDASGIDRAGCGAFLY